MLLGNINIRVASMWMIIEGIGRMSYGCPRESVGSGQSEGIML